MNVLRDNFQSLVLRVSFVLGNLTATDENCRSALVQQHNCLPLLLKLFTSYATEEQEADDDFSRSSRETTEVVIKVSSSYIHCSC
jgi:hypothetical protein